MAGGIFVDTAFVEADLVHASHDRDAGDAGLDHRLQEGEVLRKVFQMGRGVVHEAVPPRQMEHDVRFLEVFVRVFDREHVAVLLDRTVVHMIGFEIRRDNRMAVVKNLMDDALSEVAVRSGNKNLHFFS